MFRLEVYITQQRFLKIRNLLHSPVHDLMVNLTLLNGTDDLHFKGYIRFFSSHWNSSRTFNSPYICRRCIHILHSFGRPKPRLFFVVNPVESK